MKTKNITTLCCFQVTRRNCIWFDCTCSGYLMSVAYLDPFPAPWCKHERCWFLSFFPNIFGLHQRNSFLSCRCPTIHQKLQAASARIGGKSAEEVLGALASIPRQAALNKLVLDGRGGRSTDLEAVFALASGPGETAAAVRANLCKVSALHLSQVGFRSHGWPNLLSLIWIIWTSVLAVQQKCRHSVFFCVPLLFLRLFISLLFTVCYIIELTLLSWRLCPNPIVAVDLNRHCE